MGCLCIILCELLNEKFNCENYIDWGKLYNTKNSFPPQSKEKARETIIAIHTFLHNVCFDRRSGNLLIDQIIISDGSSIQISLQKNIFSEYGPGNEKNLEYKLEHHIAEGLTTESYFNLLRLTNYSDNISKIGVDPKIIIRFYCEAGKTYIVFKQL